MQFSTIALLFVASVNAATVTETESSSTLVTITSCGPEVTDCPAHSSAAPVSFAVNSTAANISTWEGAANKQYAVGAAALAAGALLAL